MFPPFNSHPLSSSVESPFPVVFTSLLPSPSFRTWIHSLSKALYLLSPFHTFSPPSLTDIRLNLLWYTALNWKKTLIFSVSLHHWKHHWLIIWSSIVLTWPGIEHLLIKVLILWPYSASPALTYHEQLVVGIIFMNSYLRKSLGWADLTKN